MKHANNIFLIGPMAAGKSTIGAHLAKILSREFYDSDRVVEQRAGVDINWIFDVEGEKGFRNREENVIADLTAKSGIVLATGGGSILSDKSRYSIMSRGVVVYLQASIEQQLRRAEKDRRRPMLRGPGELRQRIEALQMERDPIYSSMADYSIMTGKPPSKIAEEIARLVTQ